MVTDDGGRVLAITRAWPWVGGIGAYVPRGPVASGPGPQPASLAARLIGVSEALAHDGADVVAADPEVPATDRGYGEAIRAAGFRPIEEIQPSRHRVTLPLVDGAHELAVFEAVGKSTRQRIRGAERDGVIVIRHDGRLDTSGVGEGFRAPTEPPPEALNRFYDLLLETGERRQFSFGPRSGFVTWWLAALAAGHLIYLEARAGGERAASGPLAGLIVYRHGGRLSTVHSGDHEAARTEHPGALHLLRWRAIQLAIREGCREMDLGGVDVSGARGEPREGQQLYGLYQHKRAFGGRWLELTGAHERVFDRRGYALGRLAGRARTLLRR